MADVCADMISEMLTDSGIRNLVGERIYGGVVPSAAATPFVWLQRRGVDYAGIMEGEAEPLREFFDVECVSLDSRKAIEVSDAIRTWANSWNSTGSASMGDHQYSWVSVTDASEDYIPRNTDAAEHLFVSSLNCEVIRP